jgi:hypothetical protein
LQGANVTVKVVVMQDNNGDVAEEQEETVVGADVEGGHMEDDGRAGEGLGQDEEAAEAAAAAAEAAADPSRTGPGSEEEANESRQEEISAELIGGGNQAGKEGGGGVEDEDLVEDASEDELDSSLKPDNRSFAVRAFVEGGKSARKLNRRMKPGEQRRWISHKG